MNRIKGFIFPALIILGLVVVPRLLLRMMPVEMVSIESTTGILDLGRFLDTLLLFGVILAIFSAIKNLSEKWSAVNLVSSISSISTWFILSLYLWGAGDPWCFGMISRISNVMGNVEASYVLDLRFFVFLLTGASMLNALNVVLAFVRARSQRHSKSEVQHPPSLMMRSET